MVGLALGRLQKHFESLAAYSEFFGKMESWQEEWRSMPDRVLSSTLTMLSFASEASIR